MSSDIYIIYNYNLLVYYVYCIKIITVLQCISVAPIRILTDLPITDIIEQIVANIDNQSDIRMKFQNIFLLPEVNYIQYLTKI